MSVRNFSLLTGVGSPVPVPPAVMDALAAVEIVTAIGERGSFRLFFRLDRRMQLPTRFRFDSGDLPRVVLVFGTGGAASVAMDGVVVEQTVSAATRDAGPMLVVGGEDLTRLMDLNGTITRTFPGLPANVRVQTLLAAYAVFGVTPVVIPPPVGDVPAADRIPHQRGTDYAYIRALAESVGHRFTLDPGPCWDRRLPTGGLNLAIAPILRWRSTSSGRATSMGCSCVSTRCGASRRKPM